jgi:histidinol-phosphate aminotransferase
VSDAAFFIDYVRDLSQKALVIVDEAYLEFADDFERRTMVGLVRAGARVAVVRTFSKIYGLASLNIGYTVAPLDIALAMKRFGVGSFSDLNRLGIIAANTSLNDDTYLTSIRSKIVTEREIWYELFRKHNLRFTKSQGNFVFFDSGQPHTVIAAIFASRGVDIGRSHPPLSTWVRISIGLPDENRIAQQVLNEFLESSR